MLEVSDVKDAYYVDLTRSIGIPVVRTIIPGMEVYSVDPSRIGKRLIPKKYIIE
jgi:ribosomal protein S12 methylthiotransferase accessory factor